MNSVPSAARVLDLLEFLAAAERGASLTSAASSLQLPKSSALMLLRTLVARGYVVRSDEDLYVLNESFRRHGFGWGGSRFARLVSVARPVMKRLCDRVGETVLLGALGEGGQVRVLAKAIARQDIRYDVDVTTRLPAYCTAMGRVLLSALPRERRAAILKSSDRVKLTPDTVVDLNRLHAIIDASASRGYTIVEEEFSLGGTGVAARVIGGEGGLVAVLNVACITTRFQGKRDAVVATLLEEASNLSSLLSAPAGGGPAMPAAPKAAQRVAAPPVGRSPRR